MENDGYACSLIIPFSPDTLYAIRMLYFSTDRNQQRVNTVLLFTSRPFHQQSNNSTSAAKGLQTMNGHYYFFSSAVYTRLAVCSFSYLYILFQSYNNRSVRCIRTSKRTPRTNHSIHTDILTYVHSAHSTCIFFFYFFTNVLEIYTRKKKS